MKNLFDKYKIDVTDEQLNLFEEYYKLLVFYNDKFNITAITERQEVYIKHFVDSLLFVNKLKSGKYLDVGSGGGFPAIPIAIVRSDINYTLLEATNKKCEFLREVATRLNLPNVKVINGRAEELGLKSEYREKFDCVTARAVARLNTLAEYSMPFVKVGGQFISYKGDVDKELEEGKNAVKTLGGVIEEVEKIEFFQAKRSGVFIKKVSKTDEKYPRSNGKIKKLPLK